MIAMGFLILIAGAFLLMVAVAGILFLSFLTLAAGGAGFWWYRSRKTKGKSAVVPSGTAPRPSGTAENQDSRSGR
jgi:hypothetical protein